MQLQQAISRILGGIEAVLPKGVAKDLKANIEAVIRSNLEGLDFVTAEQLAVQKRVVDRAVRRIRELEKRVKELEAVAEEKKPKKSSRSTAGRSKKTP